ncbi:MAG TPA: M4 family metallopeptidase, partial [Kofleriaceae bacterium]|nr:M4 family metallopeptidase [Kofleriaceae bacterium]
MKRLLSSLAIPLTLSLVACFPEDVDPPPPATEEPSDDDAIRAALQQLNDARSALGLSAEHGFQARTVMRDRLGQTHVRFSQMFRGVRVWGGEVIAHASADGRAMVPTNALAQLGAVDVTPSFSAAEVKAQMKRGLAPVAGYSREPLVQSELVILPLSERRVAPARAHLPEDQINALDMINEIGGYQLAYHVRTEIEEPNDIRHVEALIDARTGEVLRQWDGLQTAAAVGTGNSQYNGVRSINTNSVAGGYELRDLTRPASGGNVVYNLNHATSGTGTIYFDVDNTWGDGLNYKEDPEPTTSANGQTAAVDALYGIQVTWDMYKNVLGRNGINGAGGSTYARVHYGNTFDNAFYSDSCACMTYGDGNTRYTYTALDVAAHEFTHGITSATAKLIYSQESGGLNESTSDIFGAVTEFYSRGAGGTGPTVPQTGGTWTQGEQLVIPGSGVNRQRYLYKPSLDTRSADAWSPTLKNLDVHYSSGPMNRAFYFMSMGATASGDTSSSYLPGGMTGIGIDKAARIYYRALTTYMTPSTDYAAARIAVITAARDLYTTGSPEEIAVWSAFAAINVGGVWAGPDAPPTVAASTTGTAGTITFSANASDDKGIAKVDFYVDGLLVGTDTASPYAVPFDSTLEDDGAHTLLARATDTVGFFANSSMTFTIANGQLLKNASFEKGYGVGWSNTNGMQIGAILNTPSFDGTKAAKFRGMGSAGSVSLFQTVSIPANATSVALSYALWIQTQESSTGVRDTFTVQLRNTAGTLLTTVASYSNLNSSASYQSYTFDLAAYKGQTVQVYFTGTEDAAISTGFILDRVRFQTNGSGGGGGDTTAPSVSVSET